MRSLRDVHTKTPFRGLELSSPDPKDFEGQIRGYPSYL